MRDCPHLREVPHGVPRDPVSEGHFVAVNSIICKSGDPNAVLKELLSIRRERNLGYKAWALYMEISISLHDLCGSVQDVCPVTDTPKRVSFGSPLEIRTPPPVKGEDNGGESSSSGPFYKAHGSVKNPIAFVKGGTMLGASQAKMPAKEGKAFLEWSSQLDLTTRVNELDRKMEILSPLLNLIELKDDQSPFIPVLRTGKGWALLACPNLDL
jgi:hypothetical protein